MIHVQALKQAYAVSDGQWRDGHRLHLRATGVRRSPSARRMQRRRQLFAELIHSKLSVIYV